jgi:hypothetical protein
MPIHILRRNNRRYSIGEYSVNPAADILSNLISAWPGNGTTADIYALNNGISEGGLTFGAGLNGLQSFVGNGSDSYVTTTNATNPALLAGYSLSAWFKTTSISGFPIIYMDASQVGISGVYDKLFGLNSSGFVYWAIFNGSDYAIVSNTTTYNDGNWHNAAVTTNASNSYVYVDSALVLSGLGNGSSYSGYWKIGINHSAAYPIGPYGSDPFYFSGNLQDVRYYGIVLTSTQITTLYKNGPRIA